MSNSGLGPEIWNAERLRVATDAAGVALWSWNIETDEVSLDHHAHELWGVTRSEALTFAALSTHVYPADQDTVWNAFKATRQSPGPYELEFRVVRKSAVNWISARGLGLGRDAVEGVIFGIFLDINKRKTAEDGREMLANEMGHRVKNLFTVASALTTISARSTSTTKEMATDLRQRFMALGRAQELVLPVLSQTVDTTSLAKLFAVLLKPYDETGTLSSRVSFSIPALSVGQAALTTIALVFHELATNCIKYGALSNENGTLNVTCTQADGAVAIVWVERGGPTVTAVQAPSGFGSKLMSQSVESQLDGSIVFDWLPEGVVVTLKMDQSRLAA